MTQLLQVQTAAQAKLQQFRVCLPSQSLVFSGEDAEKEERSFKGWLELFEERAKLTAWPAEQKLYQLKVHLKKYALKVFHVLPEKEQKDYDATVKKLRERFHSVDIEELKKMQKGESVESNWA